MVEEPIHDEFVARLKKRMANIRLGNGFDSATQMGPLISQEHLNKVENYVRVGVDEGACLELGGSRPDNPELKHGFFYLPTLFSGCTNDMRIVQEEVFGPVISVESFATEDEAIRRANSTIYGLAAGFWTRNIERTRRVSSALRFGTVWINDFNVYFTQAPWGGFKQSGFGRELGRMGLEEYTEVKHIYQNFNPQPINWFGAES